MIRQNTDFPTQKTCTGLCSTCAHAASCYLPHNAKPVLFCDVFEDGNGQAATLRGLGKRRRAPAVAAGDEDGACIGLCRNCDNRHSCAFAKCDNGHAVLHCEEYR